MRVLAIDTALAACSAAVLDTDDGGIVASQSLPMTRGHAEALMPLLVRLMQDAGMAFRDIDRVVVTTGPGSFTGLRVGIAAARGIALAAGKPAVGLSTLAAYAAPHMAADETVPVVAAIDARHAHVYLQVFGPGGRTHTPPRLVAARRSGAGRSSGAVLHRRLRRPIRRRRSVGDRRQAGSRRCARGTRYSLGRAHGSGRAGRKIAAETAIPPRPRRAAAKRRTTPAPMMNFVTRLLSRSEPTMSEARQRDAAAIAALHAASFQRGWGEDEFHRLLIDRAVVAHRAMIGRTMVGFILSRMAAGEAEILSVAIAPAWRGRGFARPLLDLHLRRLAGLGVRAVFLEVDEHNEPACRLYRNAGFSEVGVRKGYYQEGASALVLRRDLG